jgi:tRNA(Ile)-lysidine synthase TilS/MesJ
MVAVSGGKDSLAVWDVLNVLGYRTRGLYIDLGISEFSEASMAAVERFAGDRELSWVRYSLHDLVGYTIPEIRKRTRRKICAVCGLLKRRFLHRLSVDQGYNALVTGHNLDDEAGRLLGNLVRHRQDYLQKQFPFLPSTHPRLSAKLKPLYRLESSEILMYCRVRGIEPAEGACPLSKGATSHVYKRALDLMEAEMPGTKRDFLFSYMHRREKLPNLATDDVLQQAQHEPTDLPGLVEGPSGVCRQCGEPAYESLCSVCNLLNQVNKDRTD